MGGIPVIYVMVALGVVLVGTFVLRPAPSAAGPRYGHLLYYAIRLGILVFAVGYGSGPRRFAGQSSGTDPFANPARVDPFANADDPFARSTTGSGTSLGRGWSGAGGGGSGPKTLEFHWPTTRPAK